MPIQDPVVAPWVHIIADEMLTSVGPICAELNEISRRASIAPTEREQLIKIANGLEMVVFEASGAAALVMTTLSKLHSNVCAMRGSVAK